LAKSINDEKKDDKVSSRKTHSGMVMVAGFVCTMLLALPSQALTRCNASIRGSDGAIVVNALKVGGPLLWGTVQGAETTPFANAATCLKGKVALGCQLGAPGSAEQITPPPLCQLFLNDGVASCSAHIRGCTPGVRDAVPGPAGATGETGPTGPTGPPGPVGPSPLIGYVTCSGATGTGGNATSSCTATCPAGTQIVGGTCANTSSPQLPQFTQGLISDPGTNTAWSCTVRNQNSVGSPGTIVAQGTAICLPQ
jgi:hypothetical protein